VFDGFTSIRLELVSRYTLSLIFPSVLALAVMGLSLFLRGFHGVVLPYVVSPFHVWVLSVIGVLDCFGKIHLMHVLHTV